MVIWRKKHEADNSIGLGGGGTELVMGLTGRMPVFLQGVRDIDQVGVAEGIGSYNARNCSNS